MALAIRNEVSSNIEEIESERATERENERCHTHTHTPKHMNRNRSVRLFLFTFENGSCLVLLCLSFHLSPSHSFLLRLSRLMPPASIAATANQIASWMHCAVLICIFGGFEAVTIVPLHTNPNAKLHRSMSMRFYKNIDRLLWSNRMVWVTPIV